MEDNKNIAVNVISKFGFPIACCVALMWYTYNSQLDYRTETKNREERMLNQIDGFQKSLSDFNVTLNNINREIQSLKKEVK